MLFNVQTERLNSAISAIQNEIEDLELRLIELRENKAQLEAEKQTILTLESAAESAITQVQNFIGAAESLGRIDLIETFWDALDSLRTSPTGQLPEATDTDAKPETDTPTPPNNNTPPTPSTACTVDVTPESEHRTTETNGKKPTLSLSSAAFNPSQASLDELKNFVRSRQSDDMTRKNGTLTKRNTWLKAANTLLNQN